jgi:hypothetical protein
MGNEHCFRASSDIRSEMGPGPSYKTSKRRVVSVITHLSLSTHTSIPHRILHFPCPKFIRREYQAFTTTSLQCFCTLTNTYYKAIENASRRDFRLVFGFSSSLHRVSQSFIVFGGGTNMSVTYPDMARTCHSCTKEALQG